MCKQGGERGDCFSKENVRNKTLYAPYVLLTRISVSVAFLSRVLVRPCRLQGDRQESATEVNLFCTYIVCINLYIFIYKFICRWLFLPSALFSIR